MPKVKCMWQQYQKISKAAVINSNRRRRELVLTIGTNGAAVITFLNEGGNPFFCVRVGNSSSNRNAIPFPFVFVPRGVEDSMQRLLLETSTLYMNHTMIRADSASGKVVIVIPRSPFFLAVCCSAFGLDAVPVACRLMRSNKLVEYKGGEPQIQLPLPRRAINLNLPSN